MRFLILSLLLASCATVQKPPVRKLSEITTIPPHFTAHCSIYDLNGKLHHKISGSNCLYEPNGNVVVETDKQITYYDKEFKILWQKNFELLHHTLERSRFNGELLVLDSRIRSSDANYRSDMLFVLSREGKILKSVSFDEILKKLEKTGFAIHPPQSTPWFNKIKENGKPNFDVSHVNSFYDYYETVNGNSVQKGYLIHCNVQKIILILSPDLTAVLKVIPTGERDIHDVQQKSDNDLIFYQNTPNGDISSRESRIVTYDLDVPQFRDLYIPEASYSSFRCSSVQLLSQAELFITHSNCDPLKIKSKVGATLEYINLQTHENAVLQMPRALRIGNGILLDATGFLENNPGP